MNLKPILLALSVGALGSTATADCAFVNEVPLKSLTAGFEAWKSVTDAMAECGNFEADLDPEFRTRQPAAFAADPALYQIGGVSNGTITPLLQQGTIRPLDDLLAKHGATFTPNQLIRIDGQVMAVAMMVNTQHMMYRSDIFEDLGLNVPQTWDDVLASAEAIRAAGVVDYPLGATMAAGWNLAQEFNNMFLGFGGQFYGEDSRPMVNSEAGLRALEMLDRLTAYMAPDFLLSDPIHVQQQFQQGKIAMANLWATRGDAMENPEESQVVGKVSGAPAPMAMPGGAPATTLWWDGLVIAANTTDAQADAAMQLMIEGLDAEMVSAHNDDAIWLIPGYVPNHLARGAIATAMADPGPQSYPSTVQMALIHSALGKELPAFFEGERDAAATLAAVETAYAAAARGAGLLE